METNEYEGRFDYKGVLAPHIEGFLKQRHAFDKDTLCFEYLLHDLEAFSVKENLTDTFGLTREFYAKWCATMLNDSDKTRYYKLTMLRQFAVYLNTTGYPCHIPILPKVPYNNFEPYIFTHEEIELIFAHIDRLQAFDRRCGTAAFSMPPIIRVLYSTGIRVSECTSLKNKDVNLDTSIITIRVSKNRKERIVAISDSLKGVLIQYLGARKSLNLKGSENPESPYFIKTDGTQVICHRVLDRFRRILKQCGIPQTPTGHPPRIHDLRHTYAVHTMESMLRAGKDLYIVMPYLMTALGHTSLRSTGEYVRLTAAMFPALRKQCEPLNNIIFHEHTKQPRITAE